MKIDLYVQSADYDGKRCVWQKSFDNKVLNRTSQLLAGDINGKWLSSSKSGDDGQPKKVYVYDTFNNYIYSINNSYGFSCRKDLNINNQSKGNEEESINATQPCGNVHNTMLYTGSTKYAYLGDTTDIESLFIDFKDDPLSNSQECVYDNIPEDAIATLTLIRGNVDIITHQSQTVKIGGKSAVSLPFILVRDMSHYN